MLTDRPEMFHRAIFKDTEWSTVITLENWFVDFTTELERIRQHFMQKGIKNHFYPNLVSTLSFFKHCSPDDLKVAFISMPDTCTDGTGLGTMSGEFSERQKILLEVLTGSTERPTKITPSFEYWTKQGVMMIPVSFTTSLYTPKNHSKLWHKLVIKLLKIIDERCSPVWVLIGELDKYKDALAISNMDITIPELLEENLPQLEQTNVFGKVNELIHNYLKREAIKWT